MSEQEKCERCGGDLDKASGLCPRCDEAAPPWLVWVVYGLIALFVFGFIYRLIWP